MFSNYSPTKSVYSSTVIKEEKNNDKFIEQVKNLTLSNDQTKEVHNPKTIKDK